MLYNYIVKTIESEVLTICQLYHLLMNLLILLMKFLDKNLNSFRILEREKQN